MCPSHVMPLVLYCNDISVYANPIKIALNAKKIEYEQRLPPDGYGSVAYKKIVPTGKVPAIIHDGFILSESAVILEYIEEVFTNEPSLLFPGDAKANANVRYIQRIHDLYLEPALRALFPHMDPSKRDMAIIEDKFAVFHTQLRDIERLCVDGGPYIAGERFTFADCVLPTTLMCADLMHAEVFGTPVVYDSYPKLAVVRKNHAQNSSISPVIAIAETSTQAWLASKRNPSK